MEYSRRKGSYGMTNIVCNLRIYIYEGEEAPTPILRNVDTDGDVDSLSQQLKSIARQVHLERKKAGKSLDFRIVFHTRQFGNFEIKSRSNGTLTELKESW
jgi:hypothetical protein